LREVGGSTIIFNSQAANYGQPSGIYASFGDREIIPFIVNRKALSIDQSSSESAIPEIRVVPNPTIGGIASLQVSGLPKDISATLQVVSSIGEIIHQEQVSTTDLQMIPLTLKGQPSGAYFIRISYQGAMLHSIFMHSAE
jgi:hypothetical protein